MSDIDRFLSKVQEDKENGCWNWIAGSGNNLRYGRFKIGGSALDAHRVSWEMENNRKIPNGMQIFHSCHNTLCVNPEHLILGDATDRNRKSNRWKPQPLKGR